MFPPYSTTLKRGTIAFYADNKGIIRISEPEDSGLIGETLPITKRVEKLLKDGEPLVIGENAEVYPELKTLGVQSLLAVRLQIPWGLYFIGVCNGQDDPVYEGVDKKLFKTLTEILESGLRYGHTRAEIRSANSLYLHAQRRGRYSFLSRASEGCAKLILDLQSNRLDVGNDIILKLDDVLADYLDAELCDVMQDFKPKPEPPTIVERPLEKIKKPKLPDYLLDLVHLSKDRQNFTVKLRNREIPPDSLEPNKFPRTALAATRIYLWAGYIAADMKVPDRPRDEDLSKANATDLFYAIPDWLLKVTAPQPEEVAKNLPLKWWCLDWLRTQWQKIHYLARSGISEPHHKRIEEIDHTYTTIRSLTTRMIREYLSEEYKGTESEKEAEKDLRVNSDWLMVWLVSNVLLSRRLADYYGHRSIRDGIESLASPMAKMRYFTHLSHLVLYALHCVRHLYREEEVRIQEQDIERRLPFAEVPIDLSLSLSETQLYILSEYAYHEIGVHRELVLLERLMRQLQYELPLYAASEFYRDHLYHVIDVCLLGELLLRSWVSSGSDGVPSQTLMNIFGQDDDEFSRLLIQNWYIAALCHDLGYVVERAGNFLTPMETIKGAGLNEFYKAVKKGLKRGINEIDKSLKTTLANSLDCPVKNDLDGVDRTNHGITTWLHLNYWLEQVHESPQNITHALTAILRHNLADQSKVSPSTEPLSLLLMLCDHLQEWGRPRVGPDPLARGVMEALRFSEPLEFERKIRARELVIKGLKVVAPGQNWAQLCKECWDIENCQEHCLRVRTLINQNEGIEFRLRHIEAREGDFEPAISWLLLCRDLQCFGGQAEAFPFDIKITLSHTPSQIWRLLPWQPLEMDLLQEFASSHEEAAYLCAWVEKARQEKAKEGIFYEGNRHTGSETFTIHLNQLGRPLPRGLSDKHWKQFFKWKWQRLGQQFINLRLGAWFPEF